MKGRVFAVAAMFGLGMLANCTLPEERQKPKVPAVVCPAEPPTKAMVLATVHELHLANPGFPFSRLGDALDAYRPDMILIDAPQDALKGGHPEDASIELEYVKYIAGTRSTDLVAVGPDRDDAPLNVRPEKGDEDALPHEAMTLLDPAANNMSFEQANGVEGSGKILASLNARVRYLKGDPDVSRREAWLEHSVDKVLAEKQPKRVLVIVDPINRAMLEAHLFARGMGIQNPVKVVSESKEKREENAVPSAVLSVWAEHLDDVAESAASHAGRALIAQWLEYRVSDLSNRDRQARLVLRGHRHVASADGKRFDQRAASDEHDTEGRAAADRSRRKKEMIRSRRARRARAACRACSRRSIQIRARRTPDRETKLRA